MDVLIFVTPNPQHDFDMWIKKSYPDIQITERIIVDNHCIKWVVPFVPNKDILDAIRTEFRIDILVQALDKKPYKLFLADMDSTILQGETLDEMAELCGLGDEIKKITASAMRGEIDFEDALKKRVSLLRGMPETVIQNTLETIQYSNQAEVLLHTLKSKNIFSVLISGGFMNFTSVVANKLHFDMHFGNQLLIHNGFLTGEVSTPILDKNFKFQKLQDLQKSMNLDVSQIIAIGDGANDLPMLNAAGMGIAYYAKPVLKNTLINRIEYTDLSVIKYIL